VARDGHILTSHHVVSNATKIHVTTSTGQRVEARLLRSSAAIDLAVLKIDQPASAHLTLSSARNLQSGGRVFTVGFPIAALLGREPRYAEGTISGLSGPGGDQTFLQISVPVQPGNSGGPLLSERGEVIGVVAASAAVAAFFQATGTLPQNLNWAVKADYATPMLPETPPITYASREEAIAAAQAAVVYIEVERTPA
jgi:S1-C subfamily serine protease